MTPQPDPPLSTRWATVLGRHKRRTVPIAGASNAGLPSFEAALEGAKDALVIPSVGYQFSAFEPVQASAKLDTLASEFAGQPELLLLHAYLVAHARKERRPDIAGKIFLRLWNEESDYLMQHLTVRWLLSSVISFATYGDNEVQRTAGLAFNMAFSFIKLYEAERLYSNRKPSKPFNLDKKVDAPLPVELSSYSMRNGDLDINTLATLHGIALADPLMRRPCMHLLDKLIVDDGTVFARLAMMKASAVA